MKKHSHRSTGHLAGDYVSRFFAVPQYDDVANAKTERTITAPDYDPPATWRVALV